MTAIPSIRRRNDFSISLVSAESSEESFLFQENAPTSCPLSWAPPFMPPVQRQLSVDMRRCFLTWFDELLPGVGVDLVEWVGSDIRQPLHALVVTFQSESWGPIVMARKVEEIGREHLVEARAVQKNALRKHRRTKSKPTV